MPKPLKAASRRLRRGEPAPTEPRRPRVPAANPRPSLAEAMASGFFPGQAFEADSWRSWRTVFKALDAEPLDAAELDFFRAWTGRTVAPTVPPDELWVLAGRGSGKSTAAAVRIAWVVQGLAEWAKSRRNGRVLPRGDAIIPVIAASTDQASNLHRILEDIVRATPALADLLDTEKYDDPATMRVIRFRHGVHESLA